MSSTTGLRKALHWLPVREQIIYKIAMIAFKVRLHEQPRYLSEMISTYVPSRRFRSSSKDLLVLPKITKTLFVSRAFRVTYQTIWNSLSSGARSTTSVLTLCSRLKTHLFDDEFTDRSSLQRRLRLYVSDRVGLSNELITAK